MVPRRLLFVLFVLTVIAATLAARKTVSASATSSRPRGVTLPLMFEAGTADRSYVARSRGYAVAVTNDGATLSSRNADIRLRFQGAGGTLSPERPLDTRINHLQGPASGWRVGIQPFGAVRVTELYPGVDALFYGNEGNVEYDLIVGPGARVADIRLRFEGLDSLTLEHGDLHLHAGHADLTQHAPVAYQTRAGRRIPVGARYVLESDHTVTLAVSAYDSRLPLVIDPTITYATYFGATGPDVVNALATDGAGNLFVGGETVGADLPASTAPSLHGASDAYLAKLTPAGSVSWVTLIGGSAAESVMAIATSANGEPYVTGYSWSPDFPTTANAYSAPVVNSCDTFVMHLHADGTLITATTLGAPQPSGTGCGGRAISLDAQNRPIVSGSTASPYFSPTRTDSFGPRLPGAGQPDGFFARFDTTLSRIEVSRLIAGSGFDYVNAATVDRYGNTYIVGRTTSADFPIVNGFRTQKYEPGDPAGQSGFDGFLVMVWDNGTIGYSTYVGGSREDSVNAVVIGRYDRPYIGGTTESAETWFYKPSPAGQSSGFVFEIIPNATGIVSGFTIGGSGFTTVKSLAADKSDGIWVTGATDAAGYEQNAPDDPKPQPAPGGALDVFVERRGADGSRYYGYLLGGPGNDLGNAIVVDRLGDIYIGGTSTGGYPVKNAVQPTKKDADATADGIVTKLGCYIHPFLPVPQEPAAGGSGKVPYFAVEGCIAEAISNDPWIHVTGLDGRYVYFTADPNPTAASRSGSIALSGKGTIAISQAAGSGGGGGSTSTDEIVLGASDITNAFGDWRTVSDSIHGAIITQPDNGAPKVTTAQQFPYSWFEMTFTADAGRPYHLWIHGLAANDSWQNDSVYAQFSDSVDAAGNPIFRTGTTDATWVSLEECIGCGEQGWGWQDNGYGARGDLGPDIYFATSGTHTVRFQTREDGFSIGQVVLSAKAYLRTAPGGNMNDPTIVQRASPPASSGHDEITLWAASDATVIQGVWRATADATAAGQQSLSNPDAGSPKIASPAVAPASYFEISFDADAGKPYHLWMRMKAENDYWGNDSVWVQFSDSVDQNGAPLFQSGTSSGTFVSLEECSGCGEQGWGWQDNAYGSPGDLGPNIYFATTGRHTIRVQLREDGVAVDQIVLSAMQFQSIAPGANRNDKTIRPRTEQP